MKDISKTFGIYQIINLITGDFYVGSTIKSFSARWSQHRSCFKKGTNSPYMQRAWNKYGAENFEYIILEVVEDKNIVFEREQFYIHTLKPKYNLCPNAGNRLGFTQSEETKRKISIANKDARPSFKGRKHTEETKTKISDKQKGNSYHRGHVHTEETKKKISESKTGRIMSEEEKQKRRGKKHTEETRLKMSLSQKSRCNKNV